MFKDKFDKEDVNQLVTAGLSERITLLYEQGKLSEKELSYIKEIKDRDFKEFNESIHAMNDVLAEHNLYVSFGLHDGTSMSLRVSLMDENGMLIPNEYVDFKGIERTSDLIHRMKDNDSLTKLGDAMFMAGSEMNDDFMLKGVLNSINKEKQDDMYNVMKAFLEKADIDRNSKDKPFDKFVVKEVDGKKIVGKGSNCIRHFIGLDGGKEDMEEERFSTRFSALKRLKERFKDDMDKYGKYLSEEDQKKIKRDFIRSLTWDKIVPHYEINGHYYDKDTMQRHDFLVRGEYVHELTRELTRERYYEPPKSRREKEEDFCR